MNAEELHEAIAKVKIAMGNAGLLDNGFADEVMLLEWSKSTSKDGPKVKVLLLDDDAVEPFQLATIRKGSGKNRVAGQRYFMFAIPMDVPEATPATKVQNKRMNENMKPYGMAASLLYKHAFFDAPPVLAAIGTDKEFLAWVRMQRCARTGALDHNTNNENGETRTECDPAHYRSIEDGAGVGIKPPYSAIPLVHAWHHAQTVFGYCALDPKTGSENPPQTQAECGDEQKGREWMQRQRDKHKKEWAKSVLASKWGEDSMGFVDPRKVVDWADAEGVKNILPSNYIKAAEELGNG